MNPFRSYSDYLRDSYFLVDFVYLLFDGIKKYIKKLLSKTLNLEFETLTFRIIENLPYGFFIIFLGFFLGIYLIRLTEGDSGIRVFSITTNSMYPSIKPGSMLVSLPSQRYEKGEIVSYKEKNFKTNQLTGRVVTHRIVEIGVEDGFYQYTVKGDSNENPDPRIIKTTDILGKVVINMPYIGYIDYLIKTIPGFLIFIFVPSVLLIKEALQYAKQK